ncbi:hypothetical protein LSH36_175g03004 [Paralvinella palmiformis]|uniref:DUF547 domain-containing protein n=1 Tax=Paralvinella palmiformis TaxID=53620 RepID=A0AAD9JT93_9ANNE|nr:hypothetical protein LSH36_175g03004 [Paralvinella palmiformis]
MMLSIRVPDIKILNESCKDKHCECTKPALDVSKDLQKLMLRLKSEFMTRDGKSVDYVQLKKSPLFSQYEQQAKAISNINLITLNENEKIAFFIILDVQLFWKTTAYHIGGHVFSLDDIEHGILRGNRPHPGSKTPPFKDNDPRRSFVVKVFDPRVHFALVCGAKSCPAVQVYTAENLSFALDAATRSFCEQEVKVYEMRKEIHVSQIFQWYCADFGRNDVEAVRWTIPYLSTEKQGVLKHLLYTLEEHGMVDLTYIEYDWKLNAV